MTKLQLGSLLLVSVSFLGFAAAPSTTKNGSVAQFVGENGRLPGVTIV